MQIRTLVDKGILRQVARGIVAPAGVPPSWDFDVMTGVILGGPPSSAEGIRSAAYSVTACIRWDLLVKPRYPVHILTSRQVAPRENLLFRRTVRLPGDEISIVDGIPVTDPVRSFLDLCDTHPGLAPYAYRRGLHLKRFDEGGVLDRVSRESRQGRGGLVRARDVVRNTDSTSTRGASDEEDLVYGWIKKARLPLPERNVYVPSSFGWKWEVDLFYRRHPAVCIEVSPWGTHWDEWIYDKDNLKRNDLMAQGMVVLVVSNPNQKQVFLSALTNALGI
jgi:hypothetical protein